MSQRPADRPNPGKRDLAGRLLDAAPPSWRRTVEPVAGDHGIDEALQAAQACDRPILLRVAADASHGYRSRQAQIAERSDMWAFLAARLGVRAPRVPGEARKK